jgi:hypothetical protein
MNLELVQKLRQLIIESTILNPGEKQEWDALLELMNDKQMRELEKILAPAPKVSSFIKSEAKLMPQVEHKEVLPMKIEVVKPKEEVKPQSNFVKPPLGHIVNLPSFSKASEGKPPTFGSSSPKFEGIDRDGKKNPSNFMQKLKAILREPELPAGMHEELLPEGKIENNLPEQKDQERSGIFVLKNDAKKPVPPKVPVPPLKPGVKSQEKLAEPGLVSKKDQEELAKILRANATALQHEQKPKTQTVQEVLSKQAVKPAEVKGLEKWPEQYNIKQAPNRAEVLKPAAEQQIKRGLEQTVNIQAAQPKDLESLQNSNLSNESIKKLKDLVKHFGYYEVMQHLEKSPLYKSYMLTGSQVLQDASTFEAEAKKKSDMLDKESFERTADLLRIIQSE